MAVERFLSSGQYYENTGRRIFPPIVIGWLTQIRKWPSTDFSCVPFAVKSKYMYMVDLFSRKKNGFFRIFFFCELISVCLSKSQTFRPINIFSSFISFCVAKSRCQTVSQNVPRKRSPFSKMHHHIASSRITLHPHWSDKLTEIIQHFIRVPNWLW